MFQFASCLMGDPGEEYHYILVCQGLTVIETD